MKEELLKQKNNLYGEQNFRIEKNMFGNYAVRSDSKKFGEQAIVFENYDRNKCVDYIEERQPAIQPTYYVIENLYELFNGKNQNIFYGTLNECIEKYREYVQRVDFTKEVYQYHTTCTIGVITDKNDINNMNIVHCIDEKAYVETDIVNRHEHNTNKYILDDVKIIIEQLSITEVVEYENDNVTYRPIERFDKKEIFMGYSMAEYQRREEDKILEKLFSVSPKVIKEHLPTQSEIQSVQKNIEELKEELKKDLKKNGNSYDPASYEQQTDIIEALRDYVEEMQTKVENHRKSKKQKVKSR